MNCRTIIIFFIMTGLLAGCTWSTPTLATPMPSDTPAVRSTQFFPTRTQTMRPTQSPRTTVMASITRTPVQPTASPTGTETGTPTYSPLYHTPTFDPRSIITATRAVAAQCPMVDERVIPVLPNLGEPQAFGYTEDQFHLPENILAELNQGAGLPALQASLPQVTGGGESLNLKASDLYLQDLTGDGTPEIIFSAHGYYVFTCQNGQYRLALRVPSDGLYSLQAPIIRDLNRDGVLELVILIGDNVAVNGGGVNLAVLAWDGQEFSNQLALGTGGMRVKIIGFSQSYPAFWVAGTRRVAFEDLDQNGMLDLVFRTRYDNSSAMFSEGPWRDTIITLMWNGQSYVVEPVRYGPPEYRFQAVQDGDRACWRGDFNEALKFYRKAIEDPRLKGWAKGMSEVLTYSYIWSETEPTPTMMPPDPNEYAILTAYSKYHILVIQSA